MDKFTVCRSVCMFVFVYYLFVRVLVWMNMLVFWSKRLGVSFGLMIIHLLDSVCLYVLRSHLNFDKFCFGRVIFYLLSD